MKKVTTFKILSLLCFAMISQLSFAQISCLPQGGHITLSADGCSAVIEPGDALTPASNEAYGDAATVALFLDEDMTLPVQVYSEGEAVVTSIELGLDIYVVVTNEDGLSCWTTIIPEDKTPPVIVCPCEIVPTTTFGSNGDGTALFARPNNGGTSCSETSDENHNYDVISFQVAADGTYSFDGSADDVDSYGLLYEGSFDPSAPCDNFVAGDDDEAFPDDNDPLIEDVDLIAGVDYFLVITTFSGDAGPVGDYTWTVIGGEIIQPDPNCTISCTQLEDLLDGTIDGPVATASDACGPLASFTKVDEYIDNDCGDDIVRRTYTAVDGAGKTATCTFDIIIDQPDASTEIVFPGNRDQDPDDNGEDPEDEEDDWLLCNNSDYDVDADGHPSPTVTGFPTIDGAPIINGGSCDIAASYSDQVIPICNGTTKYYRTWTVVGWCPDFTGPVTALQIIKVVDDQGPTINGIPSQTVMIPTSTSDCSGSYIFPSFSATDNCDTDPISVTVTASAGTANDAGTAVFGLPLGLTTITVSATDDCGNTTTETYQVDVKDNVPPVMSCETSREVSLTIGNVTLVDANVFDDGSSDNCGIVDERVRRMSNACYPFGEFTGFSDKVGFFCCDIGSPVTVVYQVEDAAGNTNECMVIVNVQDKIDPVLDCPDDKPLVCLEDPYNLDLTGYATAIDNCDNVTPTWQDFGSINNCGVGVITRVFYAVDNSGNAAVPCQQVITVSNPSPFIICDTEPWNAPLSNTGQLGVPNYDCGDDGRHTLDDGVEWPADITLDGCGFGLEPADLELNSQVHPNDVRPQIFEDECDLVGFTKSDVDLPITDGACRKILRTWKVYDWCTFDEDNFNPNNPLTGPDYGYYEYNQIIKVIDNDGPMITSTCNDTSLCFVGSSCGPALVDLSISATDECTDDDDLNYSYVVDPGNDGVGSTISGSGSSFINGGIPLGTHRITWTVEDGCGNTTSCSYTFTVSDCKKPTPYANNFMTIELMQTGMVEIWASEINAGSYDNCGVQSVEIMRGPLTDQQAAALSPPAEAANGLVLDCDDVPSTTVSLIVTDVNGLWDYVDVIVVVQDNMNACNGNTSGSIAGTIENEEAEEVQEVEVAIEGDNMFSSIFTDVSGVYSFIGIPIGSNYTITPEKDGDYLNGVTTFDLVLMSKHILNVDLLDSPYKMIAADINKSGTITTFDMVELRKVILFIDTEFQNNTSWRFVDADFVFPNAANPFETSFPEIYNVNDFQGDEAGDFVAVKVGDVNCSAQVNPFAGSGDDRSANGELVFGVQDESLVAGETYTVDFTAAEFAEVLGYQFTLAFDKDALEFVDVAGSIDGLGANNFGTSLLSEGVITTSWNSNEAMSLDADAKVFSVTFVAKRNAQLSEVLAVNSRYTKAEAYDSDINLLDIGLSFNGSTAVSGAFELYQNQPNPFKDETMISFNLPEAGFASLTVFDVSGKVLHRVEGEFAQGYNQVNLNRSDLAATGVVYYQLDTENDSATKKMIIIK